MARVCATLWIVLAASIGNGQAPALFEPRIIPLPITLPDGSHPPVTKGLLADLNNDGLPDLVGLDVPGYFAVFPNVGGGAFGAGVPYAIGQSIASGVACDVDGDGDLDLVMLGSYANNALWVYLNDGSGGFAAPIIQLLPAGAFVNSVRVANMNNDGVPDLFATGYSAASVLLGSGNGHFTPIPGPILPGAFDVGDDDGDGNDDIHAMSTHTVVTYRNIGNGTFAAPFARFTVASFSGIPMFRDMNMDGIPDFVVFGTTGSGNGSDVVDLAFGNGAGTYSLGGTQILSPSTGYYSTVPVLFDCDGDGDPDILAGATLFRNNGNGSFSPGALYMTQVVNPLIGDLDGDGILDVVMLLGSYASVRTGRGPNAPASLTLVPLGTNDARSAVLADLDSNGLPDLVVSDSYGVSVVRDLAMPPQHVSDAAQYTWGIDTADFNRDGFLDVLALVNLNLSSTPILEVRLGNGSGVLAPSSFFTPGANARAVAAADVNGDGVPDAVVLLTGALEVLPGDGAGGLGASIVSSVPIAASSWQFPLNERLLIGDLNLDGNLDVVAYPGSSAPSGGLAVLLGDGSGGFSALTTLPSAFPRLADVNHDGVPDLLLGTNQISSQPPAVAVRLGTGSGAFGFPVVTSLPLNGGFGSSELVVADFDGDGFVDVMTAGGYLLLNDGSGAFPAAQRIGPIDGTAVLARDVDRDLQVDLVFIKPSSLGPNAVMLHNLHTCSCVGYSYGIGCAGSGGFVPELGARGCASPGSTLVIELRGGLGGAGAVLVVDQATAHVPAGFGCTALIPFTAPVLLPLALGGLPVPGTGVQTLTVPIPPSFPSGVSAALQAGVFDPGAPLSMSATNGIFLVIQ